MRSRRTELQTRYDFDVPFLLICQCLQLALAWLIMRASPIFRPISPTSESATGHSRFLAVAATNSTTARRPRTCGISPDLHLDTIKVRTRDFR